MLWWTLRQLKSDDWGAAQRAAVELGSAKEAKAVEPLLEALRRPYEALQYAAAGALAEIGDPRAVPVLVAAFRQRPAEGFARALAKFKDRRAIPTLMGALMHQDSAVRDVARRALDEIDPNWPQSEEAKSALPTLLEAIRDGGPDVKRVALDLVEEIGETATAIDALLDLVARDVDSVGWVVRTLRDLDPGWAQTARGKAAVPALIAVLKGQGYERDLAAGTLAEIGDPEAVGPLIDALRDRDRDLRNAAARALGRLGDPRAIGPIARAPLDNSLDPWIAQQALNGIDPRWATTDYARTVISPCLEKVTDKDHFARDYAESTLNTIDPNWMRSAEALDAIPYFRQRSMNADPEISAAATRVLGLLGRS
jgi:HEAT repeat protein